MAGHKHPVIDTDVRFKIDAVSRKIQAESGKTALIQGDHNSERFTFEVPRIVDGHDLSLCNAVQVHYINVDSSNKNIVSRDIYPVDDLRVSPDDDDVVVCSWLIHGNATRHPGTLSFLLKFKCISGDGTVEYVWNTAVFSGVSVSPGIDNGDALDREQNDILGELMAQMDELKKNGGACNIQRIESFEETGLRNLRELESGTYILYGHFTPYPGAEDSITIDNCIATVVHMNAGSHVMVWNPRNFKVECYEILEGDGYTYTREIISLLDLRTNEAVRIADISLLAANWEGNESPYSQVVEIPGVTEYSQVDLTPSVEQLTIFHEKDLTFVTENEGGVVTIYAIGQKPENDYEIQATIKEVSI